MFFLRSRIIVLLFFFSFISLIGQDSTFISNNYIGKSILKKDFDQILVANVKNLDFLMEESNFKLTKGKLYMLNDSLSNENFILFLGQGEFNFEIKYDYEQEHFLRICELEKPQINYEYLFFTTQDTSIIQIFDTLQFVKQSQIGEAEDVFKESLEFLYNENKLDLYYRYEILNHCCGKYFFAAFGEDTDEPFFLENRPHEDENIVFSRGQKYFKNRWKESLVQYSSGKYKCSHKKNRINRLDVTNYEINISIDDDLFVKGKSELTINSIQEKLGWEYFYLSYKLKVDSVYMDGKKVSYQKGSNSKYLWINFAECNKSISEHLVEVYYKGEILERDQLAMIYLLDPNFWYPIYDFSDRSKFKIIYEYPEDYSLVSVGEKIDENSYNEKIKTVWVSNNEIKGASFNIGFFDNYEYVLEDYPSVQVYMSKSAYSTISSYLFTRGVLSGSNMDEVVGSDVANSVSYFSNLFGPLDYNTLYVTAIPYMHGQAFPNLIHLSWSTFQVDDSYNESLLFRAHEVAHQWWGNKVSIGSYHDKWLTEGLSEFSALLFSQFITKDNEAYFDIVAKWQEVLVNKRKYFLGDGIKLGSVYIGARNETSETYGDYSLLVYKKAALIFHMLRVYSIDLKTFKEEAFFELLKEFYSKF